MTTVTLKIQVDKAGASENIGQVKRDLDGMGQAGAAGGQQAAGGINTMRSAIDGAKAAVAAFLAVYAGIQALSGVVRLADEYQGLSDRLRLATGSSAEFEAAQRGIFAIAQQTGSALTGVSDLYARLARNTGELGLSTDELLTITQGISQAFTVSGASAQEADNAIRQLGQGFAAGALRGDEFNSIAENAPRLMTALAESLGVSTGELRKMAAEGQLTSEVLARGILQQAPAIASEFDQMGTTVGRAFTQVSNAVLVTVGAIDQSTGASATLSNTLSQLAGVVANIATLFVDTGVRSAAASDDVGVLTRAFQALAIAAALVVNAVQAMVQFIAGALEGTADLIGGVAAAANAASTGAFERATMLLTLDFKGFAEAQLDATTAAFRAMKEGAVDATDAVSRGLDGVSAETDDFSRALTAILAPINRTTTSTNSMAGALGAVAPPARVAAVEIAKTKTEAERAKTAFDGVTGSLRVSAGAFTGVTGSIDVFATGLEDAGVAAQQFGIDWGQVADDATRAFGDFIASGLDSFRDFGDSLKRIARQIISDLVSTFLRSNLRIPVSLVGGGGASSAFAGGAGGLTGGGSITGFLGSLLGIGGGLFGGFGVATGAAATGGAFAGAVASGSAGLGGIAAILGPLGIAVGAIAAIATLLGDNQETLLRVRSNEFNGDRRARGTATSALGDIFVRGETLGDGAAVEIAAAIAEFDNLIAGFLSPDQLALVRARLENVNDTFRDGAATVGSALDARFTAILSTFDSTVQEFVGTSGTLEDRVQRLADAMAITAVAATGLISSDFGEVAGVLERFRASGEGLNETAFRLVAGMSLIDDTLLMLGGTFNGTRLQAATFAGELIELSGGLDAFAQRLSGALDVLFTSDERNQFLADQARAALNTALTGLNISGTGIESIRTQLRDQLRAAMEAGNVELTNQILTAANALGAFSSAVEALGEDAVAAANAVAFGGSSLQSGAGLTTPAGTATTPVQTQLEASSSAARSLERHTGLLERIALNTERTTGDVGEKAAREGSDADRMAASLLAQIKGLIEAAVRTQTQEGIKRTTGANKRGATV